MSELLNQLSNINVSGDIDKTKIVKEIGDYISSNNYTVVELNDQKPWGAYFRFDNKDADLFVAEFFPGLSPSEARLGNNDLELSPKILLVAPKQRLSWQYHDHRSERWAFLNAGAYCHSLTDEEGELQTASAGDIVQFATSERHRLIGSLATYTLVAEIWQHTNPAIPSAEDDIVRLQDDYNR